MDSSGAATGRDTELKLGPRRPATVRRTIASCGEAVRTLRGQLGGRQRDRTNPGPRALAATPDLANGAVDSSSEVAIRRRDQEVLRGQLRRMRRARGRGLWLIRLVSRLPSRSERDGRTVAITRRRAFSSG